MREETRDLLALTMVPGLGCARIHSLLKRVATPSELFRGGRILLRALGLSNEMQHYILGGWARKDAEAAAVEAERKGVRILTIDEKGYPGLLREIFDPPLVLYALGETEKLSLPAVAIVGSRRCSVYGSEIAYSLARELAESGMAIVSGMALGIDSRAHHGALSVGGETVAVLGTGVDFVYPRGGRKLYDRIKAHGCVVSEFPLGTYPAPQNFPVRNRIISGLAWGTVIPEASEFSGSLITARLTLEQDRELWAVPGNITNPGSYGPNHLIKQGARPVLTAQDVIEGLPVHVLEMVAKRPQAEPTRKKTVTTDRERTVLDLLAPDETVHFDRLLGQTGLNVTDLSAALVSLEAEGWIRAFPGRRYSRRIEKCGGGRPE
jgi:DNA processing protein